MRQGFRIVSTILLLCSPFLARAQMSPEDMHRIFLDCFNKAMQSTLQEPIQATLQPWYLQPASESKNFLKEGLPLIGKDGLTFHWKDENPLPFVYKYSESNSEQLSQAFTAKIYDRNKQQLHAIDVIMPVYVREDGKTLDEAYSQQIFTTVVQSISELPLLHIDALKKIEIHPSPNKWDAHWKEKYKMKGPSAGAAGRENLSIFPTGLEALLSGQDAGVVQHEFGHLLAEKFFNSAMPPEEYLQLKKRDEYTPSPYALNSPKEDFAEAVRLYLQTDAGRKNNEWREWLKNRFEYLDKKFAEDPNLRKYALYSLATAAVSTGMFSQDAQAHQTQDGSVWINDGHGHLILLQTNVPQPLSAKPNSPSPKTNKQ